MPAWRPANEECAGPSHRDGVSASRPAEAQRTCGGVDGSEFVFPSLAWLLESLDREPMKERVLLTDIPFRTGERRAERAVAVTRSSQAAGPRTGGRACRSPSRSFGSSAGQEGPGRPGAASVDAAPGRSRSHGPGGSQRSEHARSGITAPGFDLTGTHARIVQRHGSFPISTAAPPVWRPTTS